jgi:tRNA G18 (ribose-2'-O)-methylase SpoU
VPITFPVLTMNLVQLSDPHDARIAHYRDLNRSNFARHSECFIVESRLLAARLAASRFPVESVLVDANRLAMVPAGLPPEVPVYVVPSGIVEQIVGFNFHRGILACGRRVSEPSVWQQLRNAGPAFTVVVCVDVQDPTNLGTILRNAAAFGAAGVLVTRRSADPLSRRVIRVSMGAALSLPITVSEDLPQDLERCRSEFQCRLVASVLDPRAESLEHASRSPRVALLIGNEAQGLPADVVAACDGLVTISMSGGTDSLNAAVASGILLYHFTRLARTIDGA